MNIATNGITEPLFFALGTGRMTKSSLRLLTDAGISLPVVNNDRKLIIPSEDGTIRYVMAKPTDIPTMVQYGAADIGICGLDKLRENGSSVYEPLLMPAVQARISLCGPADRPQTPLRYESQPRVATSYPNITQRFFRERGINAEVIKMHGSVELAPLLGLADLVVDVVETGETLRENGLVEIRTILHTQAALIVNRASYRLKADAVKGMIDAMRGVVK